MIHILTALRCEARPLIDTYKLQHQQDSRPFTLYRNDAMRLIISGPGKLAAAAATAWMGSCFADDPHASWLNIGIAGHPDLETGTLRVAERIVDHGSGQQWYPGLAGLKSPASTILTVDTVQNGFITDACHDMEGSGFFSTAQRFATCDNIQCVKIISDNHSQSYENITSDFVGKLVSARLDEIDTVINVLLKYSRLLEQQQAIPDELQQFLERWHFSTTQRHRLQLLLQRWQVLRPAESAYRSISKTTADTTRILDSLQQQLDATQVEYVI